MARLRTLLFPTFLLALSSAAGAQTAAPLSAPEIMARVAAHQDRAEEARLHFVYLQHSRTVSRTGKTVRCEEIAEYRVVPSAEGTAKHLVQLNGRVLTKGRYVLYDKLPGTQDPQSDAAPKSDEPLTVDLDGGNGSMDRDLVEYMRDNLTNASSKDGIAVHLFPLTSVAQAEYTFRLFGREPRNGRDTFHIAFSPKPGSEQNWRGDAWIDTTAFEPVVIRTELAQKVPLAVKILLGTDVPGLGFTIVYAPQGPPQAQDLWFPVSFGTEFKVRVLFLWHREITLSASNQEFERTHVSSRILGATAAASGEAKTPM